MKNTVVDLASSTILAEQSDLSICILFAPNDLSRKRSKKLESFHVFTRSPNNHYHKNSNNALNS